MGLILPVVRRCLVRRRSEHWRDEHLASVLPVGLSAGINNIVGACNICVFCIAYLANTSVHSFMCVLTLRVLQILAEHSFAINISGISQ